MKAPHFLSILGTLLLSLLAADLPAQDSLLFKRIAIYNDRADCYFSSAPRRPVAGGRLSIEDNGTMVYDGVAPCADTGVVQPFSVVLVLDVSGSMAGLGLTNMINAAHNLVDAMDGTQDEAAIVAFNSIPVLHQALTRDKRLLHEALDKLAASGSTAMYDACWMALDVLIGARNETQALILVTDGISSSDSHWIGEVLALAQQRRVRVCATGLGTSISRTDLTALAAWTGGLYAETVDPAALSRLMSEDLVAMRRGFDECLVSYQQPCLDGTMHTVVLRMLAGRDTLSASRSYRPRRDSATFVSVTVSLPILPAMSGDSVRLPLFLDARGAGAQVQPFTASFVFDSTALEYLGVDFTMALLNPTTTTVSQSHDTVRIANGERLPWSGLPLCTFLFRMRAMDTGAVTPLRWTGWAFTTGCASASPSDGGVVAEPVAASISMQSPSAPCFGEPVPLAAPEGLRAYKWNTGDTTRVIQARDAGPYSFTALTPRGAALRSPWYLVPWVRVTPPRIVSANIPVFCGAPLRLFVSAAYASYRWSTGDSTAAIDVSGPGKYAVEVWDGNGCKAVSDTLRVYDSALSGDVVTGPRRVCSEALAEYSAHQVSGASYRWNALGGRIAGTDTSASVLVLWGSGGAHTLHFEMRNADSSCGGAVDIPIEVGATGPRTLLLHGPAQPCFADTISIEAPEGYERYFWSNGYLTRTVRVRAPGGVYYVRMTGADGCVVTSDSVTVQFQPHINPDFTYGYEVCAGETKTYTLYTAPEFQTWEVAGGEIVGRADLPSVQVRWGTGGKGTLRVVAGKGPCTNELSREITVHPKQTVSIRLIGDSVICEHGYMSLDAGENLKDILWSNGEKTRYLMVRKQGWYSVFARNAAGCDMGTDSVFITVLPAPPAPKITRVGNTLVCDSALQYQWYLDSAPVQGGQNRTLAMTRDGVYHVTIHDERGCWEMSEKLDLRLLGAPGLESSIPQSLTLHPDPNAGTFTLRFERELTSPAQVRVCSTLGSLVYETTIDAPSTSISISLPQLPEGCYFVRVSTSGTVYQTKTLLLR